MIFKKGDRVKFLNDVGGGVVTRVENKIVYVQNEDGFDIPVTEAQLLKIETTQADATPFTEVADRTNADTPAKTPVPEPNTKPDYIDLSADGEESNVDTDVNMLLAWTLHRKKDGKTAYDIYLVNDSAYYVMYVSAMVSEGAYRGIQAGMLENETTIHLRRVSGEELNRISDIRLELLFFKKGAYMPQEPMRYELKIDEFYMSDPTNYAANEYFDEKALVFNVSEEYLMAEIENTAREMQHRFEQQKKQIDTPKLNVVKKKKVEEIEEVDLHIEQLVDNPKTLSPAEMLDIQMARFGIALEGAVRNRRNRIVFIHGVGNGRLRLEIRRTLEQKYPKLRYQDASFKEYGYGATLVFL